MISEAIKGMFSKDSVLPAEEWPVLDVAKQAEEEARKKPEKTKYRELVLKATEPKPLKKGRKPMI